MNDELLALLDECRARGVTLSLEDGQLRVRAAADAVSHEFRNALRTHKPALIELLRSRADSPVEDDVVHVERAGDQPLSSAQHRLWFVTEVAPSSRVAYNIVAAVRIAGALQPEILEASLNDVVRRHEILRTAFVSDGGTPRQRVHTDV